MITDLEINDFTNFNKLSVKFSPRINIIIGENGTGKTNLLKAIYTLCFSGSENKKLHNDNQSNLSIILSKKLMRLFMPIDEKIGKLQRNGSIGNTTIIAKFSNDESLSLSFNKSSKKNSIIDISNFRSYSNEPIFIPTKEVLSIVNGLNHPKHDQMTIERIFDDSYLDLAQYLLRPGIDDPETKIDLDPRFGSIVPQIVSLIGGRYCWGNDGFYFEHGTYIEKRPSKKYKLKQEQIYQDSIQTQFSADKNVKLSSNMTAEGFKKIGILHRLLVNRALNPGLSGPLIWDEPESNLNPKLMRLIVQILLELSRNGQQIILATHDYVLLKCFDLLLDRGKGDHVLFHSLYKDQHTNETCVSTVDEYLNISPNPIDEAFGYLIDKEIENDMGGLGK